MTDTPRAYRTLLARAADEFVIQKSRFIGYGAPVETEEEALRFLAEIRAKHKDATHNCYAYIIGANAGVMRYSDDGEPGGTAGMPIIEVMKARQITNAALVVTRYFGGILLGAGGLVRAYTKGAVIAIDACRIGTVYPTARYLLDVAYPMVNRLDYFLKSQPVIVEEKSFAASVTYVLSVKCEEEEAFCAGVIAATDGVLQPLRMDAYFRAWADD